MSLSIDKLEVEKFSAMAEEWWDEGGKFEPLHKFNPVRIGYINSKFDNLKGLKLLDIGCGGGLLSEPLARLGGKVTGIDASEKNIKIASLHAQKSGLDIDYKCISAEELAASGAQFDIVLNMEVIEHVADVASFMEASCKLLKPGGKMFIATMNRTAKAFALAIVAAEYVLRWLPRGTHNFEKFLKPSEIYSYLEANNVSIEELQGVSFSPLSRKWSLSDDVSVNYIIMAEKKK